MAHYFVLNFYAKEDGVFLPSSYYNEIFNTIKNIVKSDLFTISPVKTRNKKEVEDGVWVFKDFRIYIATPFIELFTENLFKIYEYLFNPFNGIYLQKITFKKVGVKKSGSLLSGVFAGQGKVRIDYQKSPEQFSESLREFLIDIYRRKFGSVPQDTRFFFIIKDKLKKQWVIADRLEFFGDYEIFSSDELAEIFCQMFCVK
ncbi:hypothetical protein [Caldicellulosiruptor morganii]|uniref:Uncharacterized protein n=1 Tax=Caldicellulosiruptor morganii TaxID=1387555 RepID=A0ABY7BPB8_9FIRM|nr:hypothetical protein [Caldicellulosiruptor morganii]WAM33896.1 hypothetical protein OTK00_000036 [Caldicellulosiruptor morganii]